MLDMVIKVQVSYIMLEQDNKSYFLSIPALQWDDLKAGVLEDRGTWLVVFISTRRGTTHSVNTMYLLSWSVWTGKQKQSNMFMSILAAVSQAQKHTHTILNFHS